MLKSDRTSISSASSGSTNASSTSPTTTRKNSVSSGLPWKAKRANSLTDDVITAEQFHKHKEISNSVIKSLQQQVQDQTTQLADLKAQNQQLMSILSKVHDIISEHNNVEGNQTVEMKLPQSPDISVDLANVFAEKDTTIGSLTAKVAKAETILSTTTDLLVQNEEILKQHQDRAQTLELQLAKSMEQLSTNSKQEEEYLASVKSLKAAVSKLSSRQSTSVDVHRVVADHWLDDKSTTTCMDPECKAKFTVFTRRHHCRRCGQIFCAKHVSRQIKLAVGTLALDPHGVPAKVCDSCSEQVTSV